VLLWLALLTVGLGAATPALGTGPIEQKQAEARQVYDQILALDEQLGVANEKINEANLRLAQVRYAQKVNHRELIVARRNLGRSRKLIAERLRSLYTSPHLTTLDTVLGATSVGDLLTRIDNANRISDVDGKVIGEVKTFKAAVIRHGRQLERDRAYADRLVAQRQAEHRYIESKLGERQRLLTSIKDQIGTLEAQERARQLQMVRAAQARVEAAQAAQAQATQSTVVGASADTPEGASVTPSSPAGNSAVSVAMSFLGVPYVWGGASPSGFDCSGLVMYAYAAVGIQLPHSSYAQWNYGVPVPYDQLEPGDLVFFDGLGHVGMYIGGGEYVNAPHTGDVVRVASLSSSWAASSYVGARRIT
jgi:peptidoglycan DL-endopeptidase CwlO